MGISHGLETSGFAAMTLFAGLLGPSEVAGYQVAMNMVALVFMCAVGFATAASVRVGHAVGRRDQEGMRLAGWTAVALAVAVLAGFGAIMRGLPDGLTAIYTDDAAVAAVAVPTIVVAAVVLVFDGSQGVLMGALRGLADVWPAALLYLVSFWGVMVPLGYLLGVTWQGGSPALMAAVGIGTATAAVLLGVRFHVVSRRVVGRV